jgi:uracil DNA glycosylase
MLKIPHSYQKILKKEIKKQYFKNIVSFLEVEKKA